MLPLLISTAFFSLGTVVTLDIIIIIIIRHGKLYKSFRILFFVPHVINSLKERLGHKASLLLASFPGSSGGESRAWYTLFAHAREFTEEGQ